MARLSWKTNNACPSNVVNAAWLPSPHIFQQTQNAKQAMETRSDGLPNTMTYFLSLFGNFLFCWNWTCMLWNLSKWLCWGPWQLRCWQGPTCSGDLQKGRLGKRKVSRCPVSHANNIPTVSFSIRSTNTQEIVSRNVNLYPRRLREV